METALHSLFQNVKNIVTELKIAKYDLYGFFKDEHSASAKSSLPFLLNSSHKSSVLVRVWNSQGQTGVTQTSDLTPEGIKTSFVLALESAEFGSKNVLYDFNSNGTSHSLQNTDSSSSLTAMSELAKLAIDAEQKILAAGSEFKSVPYNKISDSKIIRFYLNSKNLFKYDELTSCYCYFYPLAQNENFKPRQSGKTLVSNSLKNLKVDDCVKETITKTKKYLNYKSIESKNYNVIFSPEAILDLIGAFSNFFNAQNVLDKKSLSTPENLNSLVAHTDFSFSDSPLHFLNPVKFSFDEEGTETQETEIVKNGVLTSFIHSLYTAQKFNTRSTGHAHLGSKITVSPHFLHLKKGTKSDAELNQLISFYSSSQKTDTSLIDFNKHSHLIYIDGVKALHAGVNALQGSFSLPFDGFFIENKTLYSIESGVVAGDFLNVLKNILYIETEEHLTTSGVAPHIIVKDLKVTA